MNIQEWQTFRTSNSHDQKRTSPNHVKVKMPRLCNKEKRFKAAKNINNLFTKENSSELLQTSQQKS
jgi:hypothetical protein